MRSPRTGSGPSHLAQVVRWSVAHQVPGVQLATAAIGMAAPVAIGAIRGRLTLGLVAALGGLFIADVRRGPSARAYLRRLVPVLAPAAAAALAAALAMGHGGWTDALVVVVAAAAATVGGYSRTLAAAMTRFVLFLVLTIGVGDLASPVARLGLVAVMFAGALITMATALVLGQLPGVHRLGREPDDDSAPGGTPARRFARWRSTLAHPAGWQYALRLTTCLAVAGAARCAWPDHHLHWIAVTVAILTRRPIEPLSIRTTQRALGTVSGVAVASLFVAYRPPAWGLVIGVAILAGLRPLLKARNYLAYSATMTPLIVLLMSAGHPVAPGLLVDRIVATLAGAALVVAANLAAAAWTRSV